MLCLAGMALAASVPLWGQELPAEEAANQVDPSLVVKFEGASWSEVAGAAAAEPATPPDAPSTLRQEELAGGESSSSSRPPTAQPDFGGGAAVVKPAESSPSSQKFHWGPALRQSMIVLMIEHGFRLGTQEYTRKRLVEGSFFSDWFDSVSHISGWDDGDVVWANYVGHPLRNAVVGYVHVQNDPGGMRQEFGSSPGYWKSRMRALAWSAAYSTQYELGPLSDASIGNSGQKKGTKGAVDLVTPVAGLGWMLTEDAMDRYVIRKLEQKSGSRNVRALARSLLNPSRSFANLLRGKVPWHRDTRNGVTAAREPLSPPAPRPTTAATPPSRPTADPAKSCETSCL